MVSAHKDNGASTVGLDMLAQSREVSMESGVAVHLSTQGSTSHENSPDQWQHTSSKTIVLVIGLGTMVCRDLFSRLPRTRLNRSSVGHVTLRVSERD